MNNPFKALIVAGSLLASCLIANAASTAITIPANGFSNAPVAIPGPVKVTSVVLQAPVANVTSIIMYDTPTNQTTFTNAAYTNITSYVTNYITTWTNYYGVVNNATNKALIDVTNNVAATVNNYNIELSGSAPTNGTVLFQNLQQVYQYGIWITNNGAGTAVITIQYNQ
jgi:hypothetical protein